MSRAHAEGPPVAIVGIGGVFPSLARDDSAASSSLERFWSVVASGLDTTREPPQGRWVLPVELAYDPRKGIPDRVYSRRACFVEPADYEPGAWSRDLGLSDERLSSFDVAARLALRAARDAWCDAQTLELDRARVGVILGNLVLPTQSASELADWILGRRFERELFAAAGRAAPPQTRRAVAITRGDEPASVVARALGLGGVHTCLDAACSSSLYALDRAVTELQSGRADAMLAGGVSRPDALFTQMGFSQLRALSASGRCAPFDRTADGIVVGEGAGVLLLKRLDAALAAGDSIYALVRGIGLSNDVDGNLLAPSQEGQLRAMRGALARAGWEPEEVDLIECHATGTPVGDQVELGSLCALWQERRWRPGQCVVGSVKSNVGHLLTGAGAAGLIKTLLALKHEGLPPTANFEQGSEALERGPFRVAKTLEPWPRRAADRPRRAAVSGFGFGGTNAHVLLEEYLPPTSSRARPSRSTLDAGAVRSSSAIAIVGLDARVGPFSDLDAFAARIFDSTARADTAPLPRRDFWGLEAAPSGFFCDALEIPLGRFRIPPKEIEASLPQQLLMLDVARRALDDAERCALGQAAARSAAPDPPDEQLRLRTGVYIGLALDLNTTNYHLRWAVRARARGWAEALDLRLDEADLAPWADELCDRIGPPLDANRTIGGLGSIVASRIARELGCGGPSYALSSDESSGLSALDAAVQALRAGVVDRAIVGAVDLTGEVRRALADDLTQTYSPSGQTRPFDCDADGGVRADAAVALVLERLGERAGRRCYAAIGGIGSATGASLEATYLEALRRSHADSGHSPSAVAYVEASGDGQLRHDRAEAAALARFHAREGADSLVVGSSKDRLGHAGAAAGLISLAKAALCLYHETLAPLQQLTRALPATRGLRLLEQAQYWVHDRATGPRLAGVSCIARTGQCTHVLLEGVHAARAAEQARAIPCAKEALFVARGTNVQALASRLREIARLARASRAHPIEALARAMWHGSAAHDHGGEPDDKPRARGGQLSQRIALVARSADELDRLAEAAADRLERGVNPGADAPEERVWFSAEPLGGAGKLAFVFPGSGTQHPDMGRELALRFPQILRAQAERVGRLRSQLLPQLIWGPGLGCCEPRDAILALVSLGTLLSDLVCGFGIQPDAAIGYSLGESTSLFALGAWHQRDEMLARLSASDLFSEQLAGPCEAARRYWGVGADLPLRWVAGVVDQPAERVQRALRGCARVYLLIINTPDECVIGGDQPELEQLVARLGGRFVPLPGVTTVHCPIAAQVAEAYRTLHLLDTKAPARTRFYSVARGGRYDVDRQSAADAITAQATGTVDFARLIERAWQDGIRLFVEVGPGRSCTRMIARILRDRPHRVRSACAGGPTELGSLLRLLALLWAEGLSLDLDPLYGAASEPRRADPPASPGPRLQLRTGRGAFELSGVLPRSEPAPGADALARAEEAARATGARAGEPGHSGLGAIAAASARAHADYLQLASRAQRLAAQQAAFQLVLARHVGSQGAEPRAVLERNACLEFARGSIAAALGPAFAPIDRHPTRVRLPDEPLMLVDRVLRIEGQPRSLGSGRIVTEHDVLPGAWYLDRGCVPTCIAVEAGQADLMLSAYLGIDFATRGEAVYRLLDATVVFHDALPRPGATIRYEIAIERFEQQDDVWLFWFHFDARVRGRPLMSMRDGCAGFFSQARLAAGEGLVSRRLSAQPSGGAGWPAGCPLVPMQDESLDGARIEALQRGDLATAFGERFARLPRRAAALFPGGKLRLVDRVTHLEPRGGTYGLGRIRAEADVPQDAWFLRCHFVDDRVMPGTLMYECCLHTLRIFLLRLGWIPTGDDVAFEPQIGRRSRLKCRGQVLETTRVVAYDVSIKELGYGPEPYAIADATMLADGKPIVEIQELSLRLSGTGRDALEALFRSDLELKPARYTRAQIEAFARGKPSDAFGPPYLPFDRERTIARLPGPPFLFIDRITEVEGAPFELVAGASCEAQLTISPRDWFFESNRQRHIPFAVLLEIVLQPCGWLAAYVGSALTSPTDLRFRNLGGDAISLVDLSAHDDLLTTRVSLTRVSQSAGMIIQHYAFQLTSARHGPSYEGTTYFGFFSDAALANQVGISGARPFDAAGATRAPAQLPREAPFPDDRLRMVDDIDVYLPDGGSHGLGFVRGSIAVDPTAWFFQAHFYQDPVWPGSLGLEGFLQLLKLLARDRFARRASGLAPGDAQTVAFSPIARGVRHLWSYRGQIVPQNQRVVIEANVTAVDPEARRIVADGLLLVDGRPIYQLESFGLELLS